MKAFHSTTVQHVVLGDSFGSLDRPTDETEITHTILTQETEGRGKETERGEGRR
jgi:hypothetical protein